MVEPQQKKASQRDMDGLIVLPLHDKIALGEFLEEEDAVAGKKGELLDDDTMRRSRKQNEIFRLPLFLRLLNGAQPHACLPSIDEFIPQGKQTEHQHQQEQPDDNAEKGDTFVKQKKKEIADHLNVQNIIARLEIIAASHPEAEGIDMLISYLVPEVCGQFCYLSPLKRNYTNASTPQKHHEQLQQQQQLQIHQKNKCDFWWDGFSWDLETLENVIYTFINKTKMKKKKGLGDSHVKNNSLKQGKKRKFLNKDSSNEVESEKHLHKKKKTSSPSTSSVEKQKQKELKDIANALLGLDKAQPIISEQDVTKNKGEKEKANLYSNVTIASIGDPGVSEDDSQEFAMGQILQEINSLVMMALSLKPKDLLLNSHNNIDDRGTGQDDEDNNSRDVKRSGSKAGSTESTADARAKDKGITQTKTEIEKYQHKNTLIRSDKKMIQKKDEQQNVSKGDNTAFLLDDADKQETLGLGGVILSIKSDSLLAEPSSTLSSRTSLGRNDLSEILPTLMHNFPLLRYRHVAIALCRTPIIPRRHILISRMAANCPSASPMLLQGCLDAFHQAQALLSNDDQRSSNINSKGQTSNRSIQAIINAAKDSVREISNFSPREASHVTNLLIKSQSMPDILLSIMIESDFFGTANLLLADLLAFFSPSHSSSGDSPSQRALFKTKPEQKTKVLGENSSNDGQGAVVTNSRCRRRRIRKKCVSPRLTAAAMSQVTGRSSKPSDKTATKPWISIFLAGDKDQSLASKIREHLVRQLSRIVSKNKSNLLCTGEICLYLRLYCLLLYHVGIGSGSSNGSGSHFVESAMKCLTELSQLLSDLLHQEQGKLESSHLVGYENLFIMCLCACIITCSKFPPISDSNSTFFMGGPAPMACLRCLEVFFLTEGNSKCTVFHKKTNAFMSRIMSFIFAHEGRSLADIILQTTLSIGKENVVNKNHDNSSTKSYLNVCRWAVAKFGSEKLKSLADEKVNMEISNISDVKALIGFIETERIDAEKLKKLVQDILNDKDKSNSVFYMEGTVSLLKKSVSTLHVSEPPFSDKNKKSQVQIPLCLPRSIEVLRDKLEWHQTSLFQEETQINHQIKLQQQFILQTIYYFEFLRLFPSSPFAIDPRTMPFKEMLDYIDNEKRSHPDNKIIMNELSNYQNHLLILVSRWCPELRNYIYPNRPRIENYEDFNERKINLRMVRNSIVRSIHGIRRSNCREGTRQVEEIDSSGFISESLFQEARLRMLSSAVDTAASCALLTCPHSPEPFFTYSTLCKDPLVLLKCPAKVWAKHGTRRIILSILSRLLEVNTRLTYEFCQDKKLASEFIISRDLVLVRTLAIISSESYHFGDASEKVTSIPKCTPYCANTVDILRSTIARSRGLIAMLCKQGLPEKVIDWLVELIPEVLMDARELTTCLCGRDSYSLKTTQRLVIADAALRIAIRHGSRNEYESIPLAYEALAVLVNSFSLIVGPVGVPVSVLCSDEEDSTEKCRRSAFRMLNALQFITGKRDRLRNEASMALSKIASFCKSESVMNGVVGMAATRRKEILSRIWEATVRAENIIGCGQL